MKIAVVALLAASAFAMDKSTLTRAQAVCGPLDTQFAVETAPDQPLAQPESGKALVYFIEDFKKAPGELGHPTIRLALDGNWVGATQSSSYFSVSVDPGEHHLCTSWQSHWHRLSNLLSFAHLNAEAGKTYYYRVHIGYISGAANSANMDLDIAPVDVDEAQYLIASYPMITSHVKK
jgi:hypothetical protein